MTTPPITPMPEPARLIYAASEFSADLFYATGFFAPDPFLFLQAPSGRTHLVTSVLEIDRAQRVARVDAVHDWEPIRKACEEAHGEANPEFAELTAFFLRRQGAETVTVPHDFPLGLGDGLRRAGISLAPVEGGFWPQRARKRPDEVAAIEEAIRITGLGMEAGIGLIIASEIGDDGMLHLEGAPLTSERVRSAVNARLVQEGASPSHTIVAGGAQAADPHEEGSGPLAANQPIILDVFPRVDGSGYWGDMSRTVCRGQASDRVKRAWEAVREGQEVAFGLIRDGASGKAVHQAVTDHLTQAGFPTGPGPDGRQGGFFHGTGHGLGLEIHESPRVSQKDQVLEAGHVVTVEPGLYYPDMGGVRLEDVVLVEAEGCRNLTRVPKVLEV